MPAPPLRPISPGGTRFSKEQYLASLLACHRKKELHAVCNESGISYGASTTISLLQQRILNHWYPTPHKSSRKGNANPIAPTMRPTSSSFPVHLQDSSSPAIPLLADTSLSCLAEGPVTSTALASDPGAIQDTLEDERIRDAILQNIDANAEENLDDHFEPTVQRQSEEIGETEDQLLREFGGDNSSLVENMLSVPVDDDEEQDGEDLDGETPGLDLTNDTDYAQFQTNTRINAAERFEMNRRKGGREAQAAVQRDWNRWHSEALAHGQVRDHIVDNHALLLYLKHTAERPKLTRNGMVIPHTRVGASHIKKCYFGVLRIRKLQEAADPQLKITRPCGGGHIIDTVTTYMDEALNCERAGDCGSEDAPDIVANTMLSSVSGDELGLIRIELLSHRNLRQAVFGLLAWNCQFQSGNRGDDFRALKLCELQPFIWLHPNRRTNVYAVLGCQGEEKAGKRGMKTTKNPVYTTFIAHRDPVQCSLVSIAIYFHWLFDYYKLCDKFEIDWTHNSSWRKVVHILMAYSVVLTDFLFLKFRVLFGNDPKAAYSDSALYNLYAKAFKAVGFESSMKQHLPRHLLSYLQEVQGVEHQQTEKLGWGRGTVFGTTYSVQIPKQAVLGCAGYKDFEAYDPVWRHVHVPPEFLTHLYPMAEEIIPQVKNKRNLKGVTNFWEMSQTLRTYFFQGAAAIYQVLPKSAIFRLPALDRPEVIHWMKNIYPAELASLTASLMSTPEDLAVIADSALKRHLEQQSTHLNLVSLRTEQLAGVIESMREVMMRRTNILSPSKGFQAKTYARRVHESAAAKPLAPPVFTGAQAPPMPEDVTPMPHSSLSTDSTESNHSEVQLVMPSAEAFRVPGEVNPVFPLTLGVRGATYHAHIFPFVQQPKDLYNLWGPSKTLNQYISVNEVWTIYHHGEPVVNDLGVQTHIKPSLREVEEHFAARWRSSAKAKKEWSRFIEIWEYIRKQAANRQVPHLIVIEELEAIRNMSSPRMGLNSLYLHLKKVREDNVLASQPQAAVKVNIPEVATRKRKAPIDPRGKQKKQHLMSL
ncbi:hypothetical protein MIND_00197900 [Mycena indigotica]|uniref:Ndc10 domain-containing protein n=1 Tax=Mycena indigotica TaxID=2126181 RepID=A0A8H6T6K3_9AGAR|nr:uncharacterized protein MIND_00197900 [Mycena indigotica]KAF7311871.1 hypothetical protein MIND_00197900 [Mycena indigotica]